jgi:putative endopeptidase
MGYSNDKAKTAAADLMKLETAIANSSRKREDTRDPWANYHKMTFKQLNESTPNIDWKIFMDGVGLHSIDSVIVGQPEFLKAVNGYLRSYTIADWKNYLKYHL